jgi:hypothetical protein
MVVAAIACVWWWVSRLRSSPLAALAAATVGVAGLAWLGAGGGALLGGLLGVTGASGDAANAVYRLRLLEAAASLPLPALLYGTGSYQAVGVLGSFQSLDSEYLAEIALRGIFGLAAWLGAVAAPLVLALAARARFPGHIDSERFVWLAAVVGLHLIAYSSVAGFGTGFAFFYVVVGASWAVAVGGGVDR